MKSILLTDIKKTDGLYSALSEIFPGQENPWLLLHTPKDPIAYFYIVNDEDVPKEVIIQADISGRHYNDDEIVITALEKLQKIIGGKIEVSN